MDTSSFYRYSSYTNWYQNDIICYFCCRHREDGSHVDGRAGERESFQRAARTGGGGRARRHRRPGGWTDERRAGGRACDTTNNVRFARATGGIDGGRKNEAKPLQLPLFHPLARSLASNTTVDLGCKACRQCFHFRRNLS